MPDFLKIIFSTSDFPARWWCGNWSSLHGWTHIIADIAIGAAYFGIPIVLALFIRKRRDIPFPRIFWLFCAFILACGTVHFVEASIFWHPWYRVSAIIKVTTAVVSWVTLLALIPVLPKALAMPGRALLTEQLQEEVQRRKDTESRLRVILEAVPTAIISVDARGHIDYFNAHAESLFGYRRDEVAGTPIENLIPERVRGDHIEHRLAFMRSPAVREMGAGRDLYGVRKDGTEVPVEVGLCPVSMPDGLRVLCSIVDITERKKLQQALQHHATELEAQNKELDEFAYIASHDLQEPLRKLISFAQLLPKDLGGDLPEPAANDLHFIKDAASQMRSLVQDLLTLSRSRSMTFRSQPVQLDACVDAALDALSLSIKESNARIERESLPRVPGDGRLLTQLYQNLIGNALKFIDRGRPPCIHLTAQKRGDVWVMGVHDNGIGIEKRYHEQIFVPFKRLHARTTYEGSGIGLSICRKTVERHGGRIWVESTEGQGSSFLFSLPVQSPISAGTASQNESGVLASD